MGYVTAVLLKMMFWALSLHNPYRFISDHMYNAGNTYDNTYIEDIQMFLLNMAFISSSEVENIYIS